MGFVADIVKGIGKAVKGIVNAIGDVFEAVGEAISGLLDNPLMLIAAAGLAFVAGPAVGAMMSGLTPGAAAAAGATAAVETVAGGAALGSMQAAVLGTGMELIGGGAAFGAASANAAAAALGTGAGLLGDAATMAFEPGTGFLGEAFGAGEGLAGGLTGGGGELLGIGSELVPAAMEPGSGFLGSWAADMAGGELALPGESMWGASGAAQSGGILESLKAGVGEFIDSPIGWMKSNKELVNMIGQGIQGWQKEEMEREYLDWKKSLEEQKQANWEATHQPYPFQQYDPYAALSAMNQGLAQGGYMSQANQLQQAGYQPQYVVNQAYPYAMPNYSRAVAATYGKEVPPA